MGMLTIAKALDFGRIAFSFGTKRPLVNDLTMEWSLTLITKLELMRRTDLGSLVSVHGR